MAAGNLALIFDAWRQRTGNWPTFEEAKILLMSGAVNTDHDVWTQGGGLVNADRGTDIASGGGGSWVTPSDWPVGDYRGDEFPAFGHIIAPGGTDTQTFNFTSAGGGSDIVDVQAVQLTQIGTNDYSFTSLDQSMDHGLFTTPDYAFRIDQDIPPGTDMMMVRMTKPYDQFDPDGDLNEPYNSWRVHLQNWTDLNGDSTFWDDTNGNGKVDEGEMDTNEHIRFTYGYNQGPTQQARMANPLERMDDGILLTFRHNLENPNVPVTDLTVEVSYWQWTPWNWVDIGGGRAGGTVTEFNIPGGGSVNLNATIEIPEDTPYGMYQGGLLVEGNINQQIIPISVAVAADDTSFSFGGNPPANTLYDNGHVFGYTDYFWRAESGDWRFYWTDLAEDDLVPPRNLPSLPAGSQSYLVVDNQWSDPGTDIDTLIYGPALDDFTPSSTFGPYTLDFAGGSPNLHQGSGRWGFDTSSGGAREIVSAPIVEGLHGIMLHQVKVGGGVLSEPFQGDVGKVTVAPGTIQATGNSGSASVSFMSELPFDGLVASGYGVSAPVTTTETIFQDDPNDPSTASFTREVTISNGAELTVRTCCTAGSSDIDMYLLGPDGDVIAQSTTATDEEFVTVRFPEDGTYTILVHGWSVNGNSDTFELTVDAVQGTDISASAQSGPVTPGSAKQVTVSWNLGSRPAGVYRGVVLFGPPQAPGLIEVPIEITISGGGRPGR